MFEDKKESFPDKEEIVLKFWEENKIFEKSVENRKDKKLFSFYDGPPFATGLPHYGHLLAGTIKDVIPRYKTMKGYYVPRRFGWDCHGLPVENEIEKAKELSGAKSIEKFGIANFNEECRKIVLRYTGEWKKTIDRFGRWVDFSKTYKTMDISFMETIWWVFNELFKKGLIYEGFKVMPFSYQLGTPLSNFEANLNYKEVDDPSIVVKFQLEDEPNVFLLAWTTTPWTLISNLALMVSKNIQYVKIRELESNNIYILAQKKMSTYFKDDEYEILEELKGKDLINKKYVPLFPYFADKKQSGAFRVILEDSVNVEEGTGVVHSAPAFGEVDFFACKNANIELVCPVDSNGRFCDEILEFSGELVKDADKKIIRLLKEKGSIFQHKTIKHRYPFCWRSDTPLIYKAVSTWFVAVEKIKDKIINSNEKINWVPSHIKHGRFGKWLENARDWAISRNRYWGTPIPIWRSEDGDILIINSIEELEKYSKEKITDIHRHFIDNIKIEKNGKVYTRIEEVFDCWFESGSMPYAQNHYPFENKEETQNSFPADFIAEGLDQTRGWFYTLNVISSALFEKPAFKNVIVNGIILAEDGFKMSKRLKNYPEPKEIINKFGADAVRLYMINSPAVRAEDLCFSPKGVSLVLKKTIIPLWNSYIFLSTYASINNWKPGGQRKVEGLLDKWILSSLEGLVEDVDSYLEKYMLDSASKKICSFIDKLTNWYIRRSRTRFWSDKDSVEREDAFYTLYTVLIKLCKISAPFIPFITETIYQQIKTDDMEESIHLNDFPVCQKDMQDKDLEEEMEVVSKAVSLGHFLRKKEKLKVRQPLSLCHIISGNHKVLKYLKRQTDLIKDELNVKNINFSSDEEKFVNLLIKPNFPVLGKKVGSLMPKVQKEIISLKKEEIKDLQEQKSIFIQIDDSNIEIKPEDVNIKRVAKENQKAASEGDIAVVLETKITKDLLLEGIAREIVNKINTLRKEKKFEVTDRIDLTIDAKGDVKKCFEKYLEFIKKEILAKNIEFLKGQDIIDINNEKVLVDIKKTEK